MLACADIEEGVELREGGVGIPILVFGALSISDLNGVFDYDLTPTVSSPSAAAGAAVRRRVTRHPLTLSSEDRYRHEPVWLPVRQPRSHDP